MVDISGERRKMIKENVKKILAELPEAVQLVAAAKKRGADEILEAIGAGIRIVGENYVQEAVAAFEAVGRGVKWHFLGHLQKNKVKKAVKIFDMIETVDSFEIAREIDKACLEIGKVMPVLIEINSGGEPQKFGVLAEDAQGLIEKISVLKNIRVMGLMTMGPGFGQPQDSRRYFIKTKKTFEDIKRLGIPNVTMEHLSMGMTNSYRVAVEEGASIVRIGTRIFGERTK